MCKPFPNVGEHYCVDSKNNLFDILKKSFKNRRDSVKVCLLSYQLFKNPQLISNSAGGL